MRRRRPHHQTKKRMLYEQEVGDDYEDYDYREGVDDDSMGILPCDIDDISDADLYRQHRFDCESMDSTDSKEPIVMDDTSPVVVFGATADIDAVFVEYSPDLIVKTGKYKNGIPPTVVFDVDDTMLHCELLPSTTDKDITWVDSSYKLVRLSNVSRIAVDENGWIIIIGTFFTAKLRPGIMELLHRLNRTFNLAICSLGCRSYIAQVISAIDPDCTLFGSRILDRDDIDIKGRKYIPESWGSAVAIDDQPIVWNTGIHVIKIKPLSTDVELIGNVGNSMRKSIEYLTELYFVLLEAYQLYNDKMIECVDPVKFPRAVEAIQQHLDPLDHWYISTTNSNTPTPTTNSTTTSSATLRCEESFIPISLKQHKQRKPSTLSNIIDLEEVTEDDDGNDGDDEETFIVIEDSKIKDKDEYGTTMSCSEYANSILHPLGRPIDRNSVIKLHPITAKRKSNGVVPDKQLQITLTCYDTTMGYADDDYATDVPASSIINHETLECCRNRNNAAIEILE